MKHNTIVTNQSWPWVCNLKLPAKSRLIVFGPNLVHLGQHTHIKPSQYKKAQYLKGEGRTSHQEIY